ncbi:hypothetical protein Ancab_030817 [Ancistrocladus abbreviatus]
MNGDRGMVFQGINNGHFGSLLVGKILLENAATSVSLERKNSIRSSRIRLFVPSMVQKMDAEAYNLTTNEGILGLPSSQTDNSARSGES